MSRFRCRRIGVAVVGLMVWGGLITLGTSQTSFVWKAGASGDWSVATNWVGDVAPSSPGSGADSAYLHIDYNKVVTVSSEYRLNVLTLTGTHPNLGTIVFGAGADVTVASMPSDEASNRVIRVIRDGGKLTINSGVSWIPYNSQLRLNETGDGTGFLSVSGMLAVGRGSQQAVYIGGATTNTLVLFVTGGFRPEGFSRFTGGKVVVGGVLDVRTGSLYLGNPPSTLTNGHWLVGGLTMRGGGSFEGGLRMSGGSVMEVNGNVTIRSADTDEGASALELLDSAQLTVSGTRIINVGAGNSTSSQGPGFLRVRGDSEVEAFSSELRLGVGTYSDGTYVQDGGVVAVKDVWVGYQTSPLHSNPTGKRGYGTFIISNGVFHCANFNIRASVSASVDAVGGVVIISNGTLNIQSVDETASIRLSGSTWRFVGTEAQTNWIEASSLDLGATENGWLDNYALGTLEVGAGARLKLRDTVNNVTANNDSEAVYVNHLIVGENSTLDLSGLKLYYRTAVIGSGSSFPGGMPKAFVKGTVMLVR